jgi:hypothetical protein
VNISNTTVGAYPPPPVPTRAPRLAILYYVIAGIAAAGIALTSGLGAVTAATAGCRLVFSPEAGDLAADPLGETGSCMQYVDAQGLLLTSVVAAVLLVTAAQLLGAPSRWRIPVALGVVIGAVVGAVPLSFIAWAMDFYRLAPGPVELGVALVPLAWAVGSGFLVWRTAARSRQIEP